MRHFLLKGIFLACLTGSIHHTLFAQFVSIEDIRLGQQSSLNYYGDNNISIIYAKKSRNSVATFRTIRLDQELNLLDSSLIMLNGTNQLISAYADDSVILSIFYNPDIQKITYTFLTKEANGYKTQVSTEDNFFIPDFFKILIVFDPNDSAYYLVKQTRMNFTYELIRLEKGKGFIWKTRIKGRKANFSDVKMEALFLSGDNIGIVYGDNENSRKVNYFLEFFDKASGQTVRKVPIDKDGMVRSIDLIKINPERQELYVAGRLNQGTRIKQERTINFYLTSYDFSGRKLNECMNFGSGITQYKVAWLDMVFHHDGSVHLIGERFTNTSEGAQLLMAAGTAALTGGLLSAYTGTLTAREIIFMDFTSNLTVADAQIIPFQKSVLIDASVDDYNSLENAKKTGVFRYKGTIDRKFAVFSVKNGFAIIDIKNGEVVDNRYYQTPEKKMEFFSVNKDWLYPLRLDNRGFIFYDAKVLANKLYLEYYPLERLKTISETE